jgi:hypothetical protein
MKTLITLALIGLTAITLNAQDKTLLTTNAPLLTLDAPAAEESGKTSGGWELTLGGGGTSIDGENTIGFDFSLSTNPLKARPEVWVGIAQGLYWEPTFAGSTDLFVDWSQNLWKDTLYANIGWSGGALYDNREGSDVIWRTGPEFTLQYYTSDNAFIYAGVNYDVFSSDKQEGNWRYSFGVGLTF